MACPQQAPGPCKSASTGTALRFPQALCASCANTCLAFLGLPSAYLQRQHVLPAVVADLEDERLRTRYAAAAAADAAAAAAAAADFIHLPVQRESAMSCMRSRAAP